MSEFQQNFKSRSTLAELLNLPLTDFSAFRVTLYPSVSGQEFRKNIFRLLAHGKPLSTNGKTPSLLHSIFSAAKAESLLDTLYGLDVNHYPAADIYQEFIDSSYDDSEFILRHAADNATNLDIPHVERRLDMFIYSKLSNGLGRKYQITWLPKTAERGAALVISFEQSTLRNLNIAHPSSANREITTLINNGATYRGPKYKTPEEEPVATAWGFFWDAEMQPTYLHTYLSKEVNPMNNANRVMLHLQEVPSFNRFPVLHAISKEWDIKRFIDERLSHLLRDFAKTTGVTIAGEFTAVSINRVRGTATVTGQADGEEPSVVLDKLESFFNRCFVLPNFTKVELLYQPVVDSKPAGFTLVIYFDEAGEEVKQEFVCSLS
jgi:hypothetical protein